MFYFAWVDPADTTWSAAFERYDENVFAFRLAEAEGDLATLEIVIKNPRAGILAAARKQWAWFSHTDGVTVTPLFFGRAIGVPDDLAGDQLKLKLIARPADFETRKQTAAAALKVSPWWDPVWISPDRRDDPDAVLEGRAALWHVDRISHAVTAVSIDAGPDGTVDLGGDVHAGTVAIALGEPPLKRIRCEASVYWEQAGEGEIDITQKLIAAFEAASPKETGVGWIASYTGGGLMADWPQEGGRIGGVWDYGACDVTRYDGWRLPADYTQVVIYGADAIDLPLWKIVPVLKVRYDISRRRTETVTFEIEADTQDILAEAGDQEEETLTVSSSDIAQPIDAGGALPIGTARRDSYFLTDRGRASIETLIAICRARLIARARCVQATFQTSFANVLSLSLRKNVKIDDAHLPGGTITGKVTAIDIVLDGDAGDLTASVTLAAMAGQGNSVSATAGAGDYVDVAYVETGYQTTTGGVVMPISGEITYDDYSGTPIVDDGLDLIGIDADAAVVDCYVINSPIEQYRVIKGYLSTDTATWGAAQTGDAYETAQALVDALEQIYTQVDLTLLPVEKGPFATAFDLTCSQLMIAKTVDLEAAP